MTAIRRQPPAAKKIPWLVRDAGCFRFVRAIIETRRADLYPFLDIQRGSNASPDFLLLNGLAAAIALLQELQIRLDVWIAWVAGLRLLQRLVSTLIVAAQHE